MALDKSGKKSFTGSLASIKLRKPADVLDIMKEDDVPLEYLRHVPARTEIDKVALKKALNSGEYKGEAARLTEGKRSVMFSFKSL